MTLLLELNVESNGRTKNLQETIELVVNHRDRGKDFTFANRPIDHDDCDR